MSRAIAFAALLVGMAAASATASTTPGFFGCRALYAAHPVKLVRPGSILVACGDGNFYLTKIHWSSWTKTSATGTATAHANDCKPACYEGHFHLRQARIELSEPRACKGALVFVDLAWAYNGAKPNPKSAANSTTFPCRG